MCFGRIQLVSFVGTFSALLSWGQSAATPTALLEQAEKLSSLYNWAAAEPLYAQAEKLFEAKGDRRNALYSRFGRIRGSMETSNLASTSDYLGEALRSPLVQHDLRLRLMCLTVKGDIDGEIDSGPATADWIEARSVAKAIGDKRWQSRAAAELGFQQFIRGDSASAMKSVAAALGRAHQTGDIGAEIRYLGAIGTGLALRKLDDQALSYLDRAIGLANKNPDCGYPFVPVAGKIQALINKGDLEQASTLTEESEKNAEALGKNIKLAQLQLFEVDIALEKRDFKSAEKILLKTASLAGINHSRAYGESQIKLADTYREQGDLKSAKRAAAAAVAATGESSDFYLAPARLRTLAAVAAAQGHTQQAAQLLQRATDLIEGFVASAPDRAVRSAILAEMSAIFVDDFALAAHRGDAVDAFRIIEQVRGRIVAESLLNPTVVDPADTRTEDEVRRLKVSLVKASDTAQRRALVDRLFFAEQARWTKLSPDKPLPSVNPTSEVRLSQVQQVLSPNEVILEYVLGNPDSFCLKITRVGATIVKLPPRDRIEGVVNSYLTKLKARQPTTILSGELGSLLIQPLTLSEKYSSVIVVPDGILNLVPFGSLPDKSGAFLVRNRVLWNLPSAGTVALQRRRPRVEAARMLFAVGGVDYEGNRPQALLADAKTALTRGPEYELDLTKVPNLPGSEEEVRNAALIVNSNDTVLKSGIDGTETQFKAAPLEQFRIIHLAVHGKANSKNPARAALIFRPDPPDDDGLLEPSEILGLRLNADLVVLSACETAVGHLQGEEGIANLARIFLSIGARSVVSTLWDIDDTYSLFLMKRFYAHLRDKASVAQALAMSQNDLLVKFGADTAPVDWAGFTLMGEGTTVIPAPNPTETSRR